MVKLQIIPFGNIPEDLLNAIKEELQFTFKLRSEISLSQQLPKNSYNQLRKQFSASKILEFLSEYQGKVLGITDKDIYAEELTFAFGQAQLKGNAAVVSIHRLNPMFYGKSPDKKLLIDRTVKETIHEVGHMIFGLGHCPNLNCVMSFSNTIFDVDRKTKNLCNMCELQIGL